MGCRYYERGKPFVFRRFGIRGELYNKWIIQSVDTATLFKNDKGINIDTE